jgi:hypothetical protein
MFKSLFHPDPDWLDSVLRRGRTATAILLADPQDIIHHSPKADWLDLPVEVKAFEGEQFVTFMKCRRIQVDEEHLEKGMKIQVMFDPMNRKHIVFRVEEKVVV